MEHRETVGKRKATLMVAITLVVVLGPIGIIFYQIMHNTFVYYFVVANDRIIASDGRGPYRDGVDRVYYGVRKG